MSETTNLKMQLPDGTDWADVETLNQNFQKVDAAMPGANVKETPADTDKVLLYDSEDKALVGKPKNCGKIRSVLRMSVLRLCLRR